MARTDTLGNFLTDVAEAIRTKEGTTETILASEFDTRISNLAGGSDGIKNCDNLFDKDSEATAKTVEKLLPHCKPTSAYKMFYNNTNMQGSVNMTSLDMSKCVNCESMFEGIKNVSSLDVSNFDTSSCENMQSMFIYFYGSKLDLTSFNTSKVTNMSYMFYSTGYLNEIDLSSFDFSNVTNWAKMFAYASVNAVVYVKDKTSQDFILNMSSSDRPSSWTESNVVIKSQ